MNKRIGIPTGILALLLPAAAAQAATTVVGSPNQNNNQTSGNSQSGVQSTGSGITIGAVTQSASNSNSTTLTNNQSVGGGIALIGAVNTTIVGSPQQSNDQSVGSTQSINQGAGNGGTTVGPISQSASTAFSPTLNNRQSVGGGVVLLGTLNNTIVGDPTQRNRQAVTDSESVTQAAGNGGTVVGAITQQGTTAVLATLNNSQAVGGGFVLFGVGSDTLVGSPSQLNTQVRNGGQSVNQSAATKLLVGPLLQTQNNSSNVTMTSSQTSESFIK